MNALFFQIMLQLECTRLSFGLKRRVFRLPRQKINPDRLVLNSMESVRSRSRNLFHSLVAPVFKGMVNGKEIWYFQGIRRSGNHACIDWLINARLGRAVKPQQLSHYLFYQYTEEVVFINSYAQESALDMLRHVWLNRKAIRKCQVIMLSIEDESNELNHFLNLHEVADYHIGITRLLPNVLSSRLKKFGTESLLESGGIGGNFGVDRRILSLFFEARRSPIVWHYDRWLSDATWRNEFLEKLHLTADIIPPVTTQGGGSSFDRGDSSRNKRFLKIQCPDELWSLLMEHLGALPEEEKAITADWLSQPQEKAVN